MYKVSYIHTYMCNKIIFMTCRCGCCGCNLSVSVCGAAPFFHDTFSHNDFQATPPAPRPQTRFGDRVLAHFKYHNKGTDIIYVHIIVCMYDSSKKVFFSPFSFLHIIHTYIHTYIQQPYPPLSYIHTYRVEFKPSHPPSQYKKKRKVNISFN